MTTLTSIKNLLKKLKKEEIKSLLKYLKYYQDFNDESKNKSVQLVESILIDPDCSANDLQKLLYGNENYHAFNKLLNRIKDKIYEVLLFDSNLNKSHYSLRERTIFELKKKLIQSQILYSRQMTDDIESIYETIISKAKKYEVFDTLIDALQVKQRYLGFRIGNAKNKEIENQIQFYEEARRATLEARRVFNRLASQINFASSPIDYQDELNAAVRKLKLDYEITKSATVGFYFLYLQTECFHVINDYKSAESTLMQLKQLLIDNVSVYNSARIADVYMNLSNNELFLFDFRKSIENIREAQKFYEEGTNNFDFTREIEFYARYYNGEIENALSVIEEIYHSARTKNTPFLFSKRAYLLACLKTIKGQLRESNDLLLDMKEIEKDKEGWNIGKRILTIINRIEAQELMLLIYMFKILKNLLKGFLRIDQLENVIL